MTLPAIPTWWTRLKPDRVGAAGARSANTPWTSPVAAVARAPAAAGRSSSPPWCNHVTSHSGAGRARAARRPAPAHDHLGGVARAVRRLRGCARQRPQQAGDVADGCEVDLHPQVIAACGHRCQPARLLTRYVTAGNRGPAGQGPCAGGGLTTPYVAPLVEDVTALALAARAGDRVALSTFVSSTWSEVARLVTAVADASWPRTPQDAYFRAIKALPSYRGEASARTWLLSIAAGPQSTPCGPPPGAGASPPASPARAEVQVTVDVGLDDHTLTEQLLELPGDRPAHGLRPHPADGAQLWEAAAVCGCPVGGTIRSRVARARRPGPPPRHRRPARPPALTIRAASRAQRPTRPFLERMRHDLATTSARCSAAPPAGTSA